jgi:serine phosphatase RsbU (regulator of sigma subunit)
VLLAERNDDERFATVAMVSLNPAHSEAEVVLCGHPSPLLIRAHDVSEPLLPTLPILTMLPETIVAPPPVRLEGGWGLLLFTDGLVEGGRTPDATERFGVDELGQHLERLVRQGVPRPDLAPSLLAEAERCNGGPLTDDVAMLLIGSSAWWC